MQSKINDYVVYHETIKAYQSKFGNKVSGLVLTKSNLQCSAAITSGMNNASFYITSQSSNPQVAWERRLSLADTFTITRMGIMAFGIIGSSTGPAGTTGYRPWTYAPYQIDSAFIAIQNLWNNGQLTIAYNGRQFLKGWMTNQHEEVPRTNDTMQQAITTSGAPNAAHQGNRDGNSGMVDMEPTIRFSGAWNVDTTLNLYGGSISPVSNYSFVGNSNTVYISINYINILFNGLLAQNTATMVGNDFF